MQLNVDYSQIMMFPPTLEEMVPADHPVRFIREFVDSVDMRELGFKFRESKEGGSYYAPSLLLKVWLCGYFHNTRSLRKVEAMCREMLGAMWLAGRHTPDHNTLGRFWEKNREAIGKLFKALVKSAAASGEVGFAMHALDGTKILSRSSRRAAWHSKELEQSLLELDERIEALEAEIALGVEESSEGYKLVRTAQQRREKIAEKLTELQEAGVSRIQPQEPEVDMIGKKPEWAYNCQAVTDEKSGLIIAADVTCDAHDCHQLEPMLEAVKDNLGRTGDVTVADSAYGASGEELARCSDSKVVTARSREEADRFHRSKFRLDREANRLICPQESELRYVGSAPYRNGAGRVLRFQCMRVEACPFAKQCMGNRKRHIVEISPHHETVIAQQQIVDPVTRRELLKRRRHIAEVPFARIKHNAGFRRFSARGKLNAKAQWAMVCLVENLKVLWRKKNRFKNPFLALCGAVKCLTSMTVWISNASKQVTNGTIPRIEA